jgi:hypothetical protein
VITNNSGATITIAAIDLSWLASNNALHYISVGSPVIWMGEEPPPSAHIDSNWIGGQSARDVDSSAELEVFFGTNAAASGYNLLITFDNGCQASAGN